MAEEGAATGVGAAGEGKRAPEKSAEAFRTISEVAAELNVPQHVLRFWETRFPQVKPLKRGGSRRYYRPQDVDILRHIRHLLYDQGYTIKGVQRLLKEVGAKQAFRDAARQQAGLPPANGAHGEGNGAAASSAGHGRAETDADSGEANAGLSPGAKAKLRAVLKELAELRALLRKRS